MKKNIVFRSGSLRMGGLERVLIETLQNIDLDKFHVTLFIEDDSGKDNIFLKDVPEGIKVYFLKPEPLMRETESHRLKKSNFFHKLMYNYMMEKERRIVIKNTVKYLKELGNVDVLVDYDWGATKYIEKLPVKKRVVWIHNSIPKLLGERKKKIERFGKRLAKYDRVVAICDEMKDEIERIYPYLKGKVERIYNPFNFGRIEKLGQDDSGLTGEEKELLKEKYCVAVSRLDTVQKDYGTLIKAFKLLEGKAGNLKLFIVGEGPDRREIEEMIAKYNLEDRVRLLGLQKNPYIWMKNSQFFVHSSKYEGLPTVLIEAMILDKLVISSECPTGPREILEEGKSGILYPVGDAEKLAEIIEEAESSSELKNRGNISRKWDFHSKRVIGEYEKLLDKMGEEL